MGDSWASGIIYGDLAYRGDPTCRMIQDTFPQASLETLLDQDLTATVFAFDEHILLSIHS